MIDLSPTQLVIISLPVVLLLLGMGLPVFLSLGLVGIAGVLLISTPHEALAVLLHKPFWYLASFVLLVIPLFIFMGFTAFHAGIGTDAFESARKWFSRLPGGLAITTIMGCAFFGACCGSSAASVATMGTVAVPEMRNAGYDKKLACGCVAAGGLLAPMIPPSIDLVIYGVITSTSIGAVLIAGIIPGIISAIVFSIGILFLTLRNPKIAPTARSYPWKERFGSLRKGWKIIALFLVVIGSIYIGVCTPSESASLGVVISCIMLVAAKKGESIRALKESLIETLRTSCMIFMLMLGASFYALFLVTARVPSDIIAWVTTLDLPPLLIVIGALSLLIPMGMFIDDLSILFVTMPILYPVVITQLGFDPVWLGIVVWKVLLIGCLTPPVGIHCYILAGVVPDVPLTDIFRGIGWFVVFDLVTTGILIAFPILSLLLPNMMIT